MVGGSGRFNRFGVVYRRYNIVESIKVYARVPCTHGSPPHGMLCIILYLLYNIRLPVVETTVSRHSVFISGSYYNIIYYYYYNTTVNGRVYVWTLRGVLLCTRCVLVFNFWVHTNDNNKSVLCLECRGVLCSGVFGATMTTMGRDDHKNATSDLVPGDGAFALVFERRIECR